MFESEGSIPTLKEQLRTFEKRLIQTALAQTSGNQRAAAEFLGVLPTTLHEKIKRLGILPTRQYTRNRGGR